MLTFLRVCVLSALMLAMTSSVHAQELGTAEAELDSNVEPVDRARPWSAALLLGLGLDLGEEFNPFGFGLGVRGGYTLDENIYLGGQFLYFLGGSEGPVSYNIAMLGVEAGYDIWVEPLTIRPSLGLGISFFSFTTESVFPGISEVDGSSEDLYLAPGATAIYSLEKDIFIGGDARLWIITAEGTLAGLSLMATAGMKF